MLLTIVCLVTVTPAEILPIILGGSTNALSLSAELLAIYAVWLGMISIIENTKLSGFLQKLLSPIINKLWGKNLSRESKNYLSLSISATLLGIGGASVPLGIKAVESMDDGSGTVTYPIILTIVFASSGLQFLPTTIMSLMTVSGAQNPSVIVLPTFLAGLTTTIVGFTLAWVFEKFKKSRKRV